MTIIAYRDGVMAADSGTWDDDTLVSLGPKIVRAPDGSIAAACGDTIACEQFRAWFIGGMLDGFAPACEPDDGFNAIIARLDGTMLCMDSKGRARVIRAPFVADGSGRDIAFGAMAAGATAQQAVEITIQYHAYARGPVQVERVGAP